MIEYRIHGRGGQGSVSAAYLLASAAFEAGRMCQAFPAFGAERRGAPVTAFVRTDDKAIELRAQVRRPHYLIVQDDTLLHDEAITAGLRPGGGMVVNSKQASAGVSAHFGCRALCLPADALAVETIGRPIPNAALLSVLLTLTGALPLAALKSALAKRFSGKVLEGNLTMVDRAAGMAEPGAWEDKEHA